MEGDGGLGNMFDDLDFGVMSVQSPIKEEEKKRFQRTRSDSLSKMTLRGVESSIDIDDLIALEDQKQEKKWTPKYSLEDPVEALWQEDLVWYTVTENSDALFFLSFFLFV
jgi:hypothetical protein